MFVHEGEAELVGFDGAGYGEGFSGGGHGGTPALSPSSNLLNVFVGTSAATEDAINTLYRMLGSSSLLNEKSSLSGSNFDFHVVVHSETLSEMLRNSDLATFGYSHDATSVNRGFVKSYLLSE